MEQVTRTYKARFDEDRRKTRTLVYNPGEKSISCSCRNVEFTGILCSHALKVFHELQYKSLSPRYYFKRWTREISEDAALDPYGDLIPNDNNPSATAHYSELSHRSQKIINKERRVDLEKEKLEVNKSAAQQPEKCPLLEPPKKTRGPAKRRKNALEPKAPPAESKNSTKKKRELPLRRKAHEAFIKRPWFLDVFYNRTIIKGATVNPHGVYSIPPIHPYHFMSTQHQGISPLINTVMPQPGSSHQVPPSQ
ncbi:hypothetical protein C5167_042465 [Papaver somniferum]|uniref:Protein FAR1-RELATED SEQUENCE n=1 Tax=Papaver somniferum TaxID=3469 RepID=A0A4Y7L5I5_PAPSO|nr:hypothetical protein C5167_042465 [Papaver somniferum]